jgi:predicted enzyme related to lactoylglutathione lyase
MSYVTSNQPTGTPTWLDLGVPDLRRAMEFYRALFGWDYREGTEQSGYYTMCMLRDRPVAALMPNPDKDATEFWWNTYFATADCDATAKRITEAGGTVLSPPMDVMDQGRMAIAKDPVGAQFGLWQGRKHIGAEVVNEPGSLVRNDLVTPTPEPAREFYAAVFDYTLEGNDDMPDLDFTFLHRPDGHEIGGIIGEPDAARSRWGTLFEVDDADAASQRAKAAGGSPGEPIDNPYARIVTITDPFGAEFSVGSRPAADS